MGIQCYWRVGGFCGVGDFVGLVTLWGWRQIGELKNGRKCTPYPLMEYLVLLFR